MMKVKIMVKIMMMTTMMMMMSLSRHLGVNWRHVTRCKSGNPWPLLLPPISDGVQYKSGSQHTDRRHDVNIASKIVYSRYTTIKLTNWIKAKVHCHSEQCLKKKRKQKLQMLELEIHNDIKCYPNISSESYVWLNHMNVITFLCLMNPSPPGHCWQVIWAGSVDGQPMNPGIMIIFMVLMLQCYRL